MTFRGLTINHKTAKVALREELSIAEPDLHVLLKEFSTSLTVSELFILSTCNRTEVYYMSEENLDEVFLEKLAERNGYNSEEVHKATMVLENEEAARHLFRVAMGLESQVLGDLQIINQVKRAYQAATDLELAGPYLHRLLHTIFYANKKVVQQTTFRDGAASVSYATFEMATEFTDHIQEPVVLILGAGEMGSDVARFFAEEHAHSLYIANRTYSKAKALAEETQAKPIQLNQIGDLLPKVDILISTLGLSEPILSQEDFKDLPTKGFRYCFDLGVPRSINPNSEKEAGVILYNIDDINSKTQEALDRRRDAIEDVELIVEENLSAFLEWSKEMQFSPVLQQLKQALEQIRQEELLKYAKKHSKEELAVAEKVTLGMLNQILKKHAIQLKIACRRGMWRAWSTPSKTSSISRMSSWSGSYYMSAYWTSPPPLTKSDDKR